MATILYYLCMNRAVVIGGFAEHRTQLEPVADAACELGLADDADVFTYLDAMNSDGEVERALRGQTAITHSAGIMAIQNGSSPGELHTYNGPEPRTALGLAFSALRKTLNHQIKTFTGPDRVAHATANAANALELASHLPNNLKAMHEIKKFSTVKRLGEIATSDSTWIQMIISTKDEFFKPESYGPQSELYAQRILPQLIEGGHDELLIRPHDTITQTVLR